MLSRQDKTRSSKDKAKQTFPFSGAFMILSTASIALRPSPNNKHHKENEKDNNNDNEEDNDNDKTITKQDKRMQSQNRTITRD
jgi:hypothetical protein